MRTRALGLDFFLDQLGLQLGQSGVHGPGGDEDFGDENLVVLEQDTQALHADDQPLVEDLTG